jgi:hypothetical protein
MQPDCLMCHGKTTELRVHHAQHTLLESLYDPSITAQEPQAIEVA